MARVPIGVSYWLPQSEFRLHVTRRRQVVVGRGASKLKPVTDVDLTTSVIPDRAIRQVVSFDVGLLEKIDTTFTFSDRGLLLSLSADAGRDLAPAISLVAKAVALAAVAAVAPTGTPRKSLEQQWADQFPELSGFLTNLETKASSLMSAVAAGSAPSDVVEAGSALEAVQSQLGAISHVRREWIAAQAITVDSIDIRLLTTDLMLVPGRDLPKGLDSPDIPEAQAEAAERGVLVAFCDDSRPNLTSEAQGPGGASAGVATYVDSVPIRGSRPVQVGVYLRGARGDWSLDTDALLDMDVVDIYSNMHEIPLNGSWKNQRKMVLDFHADGSLKSFGLSTTSNASSIATALGGVADSAGSLVTAYKARPTQEARDLEKAQSQLDLAKATSEMEVLSATRSRAAELALLEQDKKLRESRA